MPYFPVTTVRTTVRKEKVDRTLGLDTSCFCISEAIGALLAERDGPRMT